jgi:hypothetical protein
MYLKAQYLDSTSDFNLLQFKKIKCVLSKLYFVDIHFFVLFFSKKTGSNLIFLFRSSLIPIKLFPSVNFLYSTRSIYRIDGV